MMNKKMNIARTVRLPNLILLHGLLAIFALLQCERTPTKPVPEIPFAGRALLENQAWHDGITVIRSLMTDSLLVRIDTTSTDSSGKYIFPEPKTPGTYLVTSYYPYFIRDTVRVQVTDKGLEAPIPDMRLKQYLRIMVQTGKTTYSMNDTIDAKITVTNVGVTNIVAPAYDLGFASFLVPVNNLNMAYFWPPDYGPNSFTDCLCCKETYRPGESKTVEIRPKIIYGFTVSSVEGPFITPGQYLHYIFGKCWGKVGLRITEPIKITIVQ